MNEFTDLDLHRTPGERPPPEPSPARPAGVWIVAAALVAAASVAAYFAFIWRPRAAPASAPASAPAIIANENPPALGGTADPITIPPLDDSDRVVRTLIQALSESPAVMAWLPTNGLIRNVTVVVTNIAEGATPAKQLKVLRPPSAFRIVERNGTAYVDPRSYDRYARIADAVASVNPAGAARLFATLKPRIEEAHRELGGLNQPFDRTLERAIVALLDTPVVDGPVPLKPKGIGYAYADERLESLTAAQKQLLRMGPRNMRIIQAKLREIAVALGIRPAQLPPGRVS